MEFRPRRITSTLLIVTLLASTLLTPFQTAWAQTTASDDLKQIEYKYYFRGKYQQAIESLRTFLARIDLSEADAMRAREVLAASYVLGGAPAMGKQMFADLIAKDPAYRGPDPNVFKLEVVDAYAKARSEYVAAALESVPTTDDSATRKDAAEVDTYQGLAAPTEKVSSKPIYKKWWFYAGAAALLAGIGVAMGGGNDGSGPPAQSGGVTVGVIVE
jgi:hypothetical protein